MATIVFLAFCDPAISPWHVAFGALLVATASATQDIVIDAFRVESLDKNEQAAGMASYVAAYRIGMLASTAGVLYLVAGFELLRLRASTAAWKLSFIGMAVLVLVGIVTTIAATEPQQSAVAEAAHAGEENSLMRRRRRPPIIAFADFLTRDAAIVVLLFVVLYKFCDAFAGAMTAAFVIKIGFSRRRLRQHRQRRRPRRHPDRRLCRRRAGGALQPGDLPVDRRASCRWLRTSPSPGWRWSAPIIGRWSPRSSPRTSPARSAP